MDRRGDGKKNQGWQAPIQGLPCVPNTHPHGCPNQSVAPSPYPGNPSVRFASCDGILQATTHIHSPVLADPPQNGGGESGGGMKAGNRGRTGVDRTPMGSKPGRAELSWPAGASLGPALGGTDTPLSWRPRPSLRPIPGGHASTIGPGTLGHAPEPRAGARLDLSR